jgi:hypothetical protein
LGAGCSYAADKEQSDQGGKMPHNISICRGRLLA